MTGYMALQAKITVVLLIMCMVIERSSANCRCGVEGIKNNNGNRISGGAEINPENKYPWLVRIFLQSGGSSCGGTLVAKKYVVTAAHCTAGLRADQLKIAIGAHNLNHVGSRWKPLSKFIAIKSKVEHPRYQHNDNDNGPFKPAYDSAVMELAEEVDINTYTPACLARSGDDTTYDGLMATIAGWGQTSNPRGGRPGQTFTPYEVEVKVNTRERCAKRGNILNYRENHNNNMMCVGVNEARGTNLPASCRGDSGGPVTHKSNDQHILIGAVSFGSIYCGEGQGSGIARISAIRDWIEKQMPDAEFCGNTPEADEYPGGGGGRETTGATRSTTSRSVTTTKNAHTTTKYDYHFHEDKKTFHDAKQFCEDNHVSGVLATVKDADTNAHLTTLADKSYWIGLYQPRHYMWSWADGSRFWNAYGHYNNWLTERRAKFSFSLLCAKVFGSGADVGYWLKTDCQEKHSFVCQTPKKK